MCFSALWLVAAAGAQTITGTVFSDADASGDRDAGEIGVPAIVVSAFDTAGSLAAQTASCGTSALTVPANPPFIPSNINVTACAAGAEGTYTLAGLTAGAVYRVEFTWSDPFLVTGALGSASQGAVRFETAGATGVDQGVLAPEDFCQNNPRLVAGCFVFPPPFTSLPPWDPTRTDPLISSWLYNDRFTTATNAEIHAHDSDADYGDMGHVFGTTVHRATRRVFFAAIASPTWDDGPLGMGGLYTADYTGTDNAFVPGSVSNFVDLAPLIDLTNQNPVTMGVLDRFGEQGLGGIDFSVDDQVLWTINMGNGSLVRIDIGNPPVAPVAGDITETAITGHGCSNGSFRPTAVETYRGSVFIGGVCDASSGILADLKAVVVEFDGMSFTQRMSADLDYTTNQIFPLASFNMAVWSNTDDATAPQPILTNLAFDDDGSLILGLMPRIMYNSFAQTAGWLLRAQVDGSGNFTLESAGVSGALTSTARTTWSGSGFNGANPPLSEGPGGDYFFENGIFSGTFQPPPFMPVNAATYHPVLFSAGVTVVPGTGEISAGYTDPLSINAFGIRHLDRTNGRTVAGLQFGGIKVALVSDVDAICLPSPIEIGNRVWCDAPGGGDTPNGIQDPIGTGSVDMPLAGVTVNLSCNGGALTASTTTAADGSYSFNDGNVSGGLPPGATCTVSIDTAANAAALGICNEPAPPNVGAMGDPGQDLRDSDGTDMDMNGVVESMVTIGGRGANDHTIDFGFRTAAAMPMLTATKTDAVVVDGDFDGMLDAGDTLRYTVVVTNSGSSDATTVNLASSVDANTTLVVGSVTTTQGSVTTGNTAGDSSVAVDVGTVAMGGGSVTITFDVTLNSPVPIGVTEINCQALVTSGNHPDLPTDDPDDPPGGDPTDTPVDAAPILSATKVDSLLVDGDFDGRVDAGDTVRYTVVVANTGDQEAANVDFTSSVDGNTSLVVGSVTTTQGSVTTGNTGGDTSVAVDIGNLAAPTGTVTITFDVVVDMPIPAGVTQISCQGTTTGDGGLSDPTDDPDDPNGDDDPTDTPLDLGEDFGDAPDSYTTSASPSHRLDSVAGIFLGACVDAEGDGQPNTGADGDDTNLDGMPAAVLGACTGNDDEDGVTFTSMLMACSMGQVTVTSAGTGAILNAWIDFDHDGTFDHPAEQIFSDQALTGSDSLMFAVPCDARSDNTFARFRVDSAGGLSPTGAAANGEVEDYPVVTKGADFGDAPDSYSTLFAAGAYHTVDPSTPLFLGACVDTEANGQPVTAGNAADGDDSGAGLSELGTCATANDDEDGVTFDSMIVACGSADVTVTASMAGVLNAWLDFGGDGSFDPGDQVFTDQALNVGANSLSFNVPCDTLTQSVTYARFRVATAGGLGSAGGAANGEVEDYDVATKGLDLGDAPDSYGTQDPSTAASHIIDPTSTLYLGACVDTEAQGQPVTSGNAADGDDLGAGLSDVGGCGSADDEDGISFDSMVVACGMADISVTANSAGQLDAWLDFAGDGGFDSGDQIFTNQAVSAGVNNLSFNVPCDTSTQAVTYARFRLSTVGALGALG